MARSIMIVFNPPSSESLAAILNMKMEGVRTVIRRLHSIFIVLDSGSEPIQICHKLVADYLRDDNRCRDKKFHDNPSILHLELGLRCRQVVNNFSRGTYASYLYML
jgi:hypothetical protein